MIRFYQIIPIKECSGEDEEKMLLFFKKSKQTTNIAHLDNDNDRLVSGVEDGEIVAWDFQIGSKLGTVQSDQNINIIKVINNLGFLCQLHTCRVLNHPQDFKTYINENCIPCFSTLADLNVAELVQNS